MSKQHVMADRRWIRDSADGILYAQALALGADEFTLSARERAQAFVNIKRALQGKCNKCY